MNTKAFTLIELIVGITISMLLMTSVGVFMTNGISNILSQQKALENNENFIDFSSSLGDTLSLIGSGAFIEKTSSGILFKRDKLFGEGGFSYIGFTGSTIDSNGDGIYCLSGSDNDLINTNHIFIKTFIPFEEKNENMFTNFDDILISKPIIINGKKYISYQKEHVIKNDSGDIIIGKGVFGDQFTESTNGTGIYLNSPTGLTSSGSILFISDTLNNRILWYNTTNNTIHKLLDEYDGLNEPTGLFYNTSEKYLFIANSGNGELLTYSSKKNIPNPNLEIKGLNGTNINKIELSFSGSNTPDIINTGTWKITTYSGDYYLTGTTDTLLYYNILKGSESNQIKCNGKSNGDYIFDITEPTKPTIYCTKSGSGKTLTYPTSTISEIKILGLNGFSNTGSYYVNLKLNNAEKGYFPYFTQGDDDILTKGDNILKNIQTSLDYPTGVRSGNGFTQVTKGYGGSNYTNRTFPNLSLNYNKYDNIFQSPIKSLIIDTTDDLLSIVGKYYKKYNCYNIEEKIENTFLFKKSLK